jgi:hypothetical protein
VKRESVTVMHLLRKPHLIVVIVTEIVNHTFIIIIIHQLPTMMRKRMEEMMKLKKTLRSKDMKIIVTKEILTTDVLQACQHLLQREPKDLVPR